MKKTLAIILSIMLLTLSFTACAKKDTDKKEKTKTESVEKEGTSTEKAKGNSSAPDESTPATEGGETAQPDDGYAEGTDMNEFESLVDTFNNSEDEEAKEAARIELEKILEQAEKQTPQQ